MPGPSGAWGHSRCPPRSPARIAGSATVAGPARAPSLRRPARPPLPPLPDRAAQGTVLMALLQPPPEVFDLFDDVLLLSEGRVVYHGPTGRVAPFFAGLGFAVPERKGVADFLQEVTSRRDQGQYWARGEAYRFVPVEEFHKVRRSRVQGWVVVC